MRYVLSEEDEARLISTCEPQNYEEWLFVTGNADSPENRGWYECPEDERAQYIRDHPEWWENF